MGGSWTTQNKVRPGVYINFQQTSMQTEGLHRGIVTMPLALSFGPEQAVVEVSNNTDTLPIFGEELENLVPVREALKRAEKVLVYRLNAVTGAAKATATLGNLTATAKYTGTKGNDFKITVEADSGKFNVKTFIGTKLVDSQEAVSAAEDLQNNEFVIFSGTGVLSATAGTSLTGGTDSAVNADSYTAYRDAIEVYYFNTCALYDVTDTGIKDAFKQWIVRLRDDEGNKVVLVTENYASANYEGIISVKNGVVLEEGTTLEAKKVTAWVAGATAAANTNKSLTYDFYDGAVDVDTKYNYSVIETAINDGEFLFTGYDGKARVEYDINTLHTYTADKGRMFRKNRVIRTLDAINNDITKIGNDYFIGKISNNEDGRNLLKNEIIKCLQKYENNDSISNLDTQEDVQVLASTDTDVVVVRIAAQPVDGMEKLYMTVEVK